MVPVLSQREEDLGFDSRSGQTKGKVLAESLHHILD